MNKIILLIATLSIAFAAIPLTKNQKTFGHAIKNGYLKANTELTTFEHNCTNAPCVITQIHCPGTTANYTRATVRFYIDGDTTPTLEMTLLEMVMEGQFYEAHGGQQQDGSPWGHQLFGKTAWEGGMYSTLRIPFQKSIKTTLQSPDDTGDVIFWWIIRGVENMPVIMGDYILPNSAQLKLYRFDGLTQPLDLVTLANVSKGTAGAILAVKFDSQSQDYNFLEACMRVQIDGADQPMFLSSGAEDYFLSAFYFDEGMFKTPNSGLTFYDGKGTLSVYKMHDRDPVLFNDGLVLTFRNNENTNGCGSMDLCPNQYCAPGQEALNFSFQQTQNVKTAPAKYDTLVWIYEWPNTDMQEKKVLQQQQQTDSQKNGRDDVMEAIQKIGDMYDNGMLTEQEEITVVKVVLQYHDESIIKLTQLQDQSKAAKYLKSYLTKYMKE